MADIIKKATRESYGEALAELADENPNVVVLDADLAERILAHLVTVYEVALHGNKPKYQKHQYSDNDYCCHRIEN